MRTIWDELPAAFCEPANRRAREAMMLAATLAGIAFSNASVALVHGMSRPIGVFFHVPHGLSNAMLLPAVTAFSVGAAADRYADCARAMGVAARRGDRRCRHRDSWSTLSTGGTGNCRCRRRSSYGIPEERYFDAIPTMAAQALASGSPQNNPRVPTPDEIAQLYRRGVGVDGGRDGASHHV